jgi:hypothetical protein
MAYGAHLFGGGDNENITYLSHRVRKRMDACGIYPVIVGNKYLYQLNRIKEYLWSGREDLNLRPLAPHASALPGCATSRPERLIYHPIPILSKGS